MRKSKSQTAEYHREWYRANKEKRIGQIRAYQSRVKQFVTDYKTERGCKYCNENHPACLDFHHRDGEEKEINIGQMHRSGWGVERMKIEMAKCDVVCSNCHRKIHYKERRCAF